MKDSTYGLAALERALNFSKSGGRALDIGCGCEGRFVKLLTEHNFECSGVDISSEMILLAKERYPKVKFFVADICEWKLPEKYDLITAWDSTFHLPLDFQEPVLEKLCTGLKEGGVLLFTCGGGEKAGTVKGEFGGQAFEYSTLGVPEFIQLLWKYGCAVQHVDYDQFPEKHVYIIAKKI